MAAQVILNRAALRELLVSPTGPVAQDLLRRGRNVESAAKRLCPVDTGRLRSSVTTQLTDEGGIPVVLVGTNVNYALFVHEGTGIFGPNHRPIRPTRARFLVFTPRGARGPVFAREVSGSPGRPFLVEALPAAAA